MEKGTRSRPAYLRHRCNSQREIDAALAAGFDGVEIDLVWREKEPCLRHSHGGKGEFLSDVDFRNCIVAVNIKEYGMAKYLALPTAREWFAFDVPGPEIDLYLIEKVRVFGRFSQFEDQCRVKAIAGTLVDDFTATKEGQGALMIQARPPVALISNQLRFAEDSAWVREASSYIILKDK